MKKLFFTMMLAIVSSGLLTAKETICVPESPDALYQEWTSVSGTIQHFTSPCMEGEDCPGCLAWAIVTEDKTYYLSTRNNSVRNFLEQIYGKAIPAIYLLPLKATASGIPYQKGEYNFIAVNSINGISVEYFGSPTDRIPSLCDEWHMLSEPWNCAEPSCYLRTTVFRAATDTIVNHVFYRKLEYTDESPLYGTRVIYKGALREGDNSDIYYIPANSEHEYLMYAFNAHVGDTLENLWIGGVPEECPNGYVGVVTGISDGEQPEYTILGVENERGEITWGREWVKGVGFKDNPTGPLFYLNAAVDYGVETILCAYKDGQQVYASKKSEEFGCTFNGYQPTKPHTDTMPYLPMFENTSWTMLEAVFETCFGYTLNNIKDTIIGEKTYRKFSQERVELVMSDDMYARQTHFLREDIEERRIYKYNTRKERDTLLYDFSLQIGDSLPGDYTLCILKNISYIENAGITRRKYSFVDTAGDSVIWIEGIGNIINPIISYRRAEAWYTGARILCVENEQETVYDIGDFYSFTCDKVKHSMDSILHQKTDTIPMYIKDGPGTSTVEPVDPNQIIVTLNGDKLTIHEYLGTEISYVLTKAPSGNNIPARNRKMASDTFSESVSIQLTESGLYTLTLTSPDWDYCIVGTFEYDALQGVEIVETSFPAAQKILRNGQLLIRKGDKTYTVQGIEIK